MKQEIKDLKRKKASFSFNKIEGIGNKKFKGHIKNIPMYIYNNGLIATIAFILKKRGKEDERKEGSDKESYYKIGQILEEYFNRDFVQYYDKFEGKKLENIVKLLIECDSKLYRRITLDILSVLEWLVRFSDAMLEGEGENSDQK